MTSWPSSASRAAATDESTPPDMATTIRIRIRNSESGIQNWNEFLIPNSQFQISAGSRQAPQLLHQPRQHVDDAVDFLDGREHAEAESQRVLRAVRRQAHRA